jgi:2-keto-4-pentenoate hydratase
MSNIAELAKLLDDAALNATEVTRFDREGRLSLDEAYRIQAESIRRRLDRGERRVGVKMGFTSRAKMVQMGLSDVIWGRLTDAMQIEEGTAIDLSRFVHARCEPEIDFSNLGLTVSIDGRVVQVGSTAALLGHPLRSLVAAARLSAEAGEPLQAGWVVMAGGATPAEWIKLGQYTSVDMEQLGSVGFHVAA